MRHLSPNLDMLRRALRVKVCADCPRRPPGSECLDCDTPRACETHCPIFIHLPQIKAIGEQVDTMIASRERVLRGVMDRIREIHDRGEPPRLDRGTERPVLHRAQANKVARVVDRLMGC